MRRSEKVLSFSLDSSGQPPAVPVHAAPSPAGHTLEDGWSCYRCLVLQPFKFPSRVGTDLLDRVGFRVVSEGVGVDQLPFVCWYHWKSYFATVAFISDGVFTYIKYMKEQNCIGLSSSNALHDQMIKDMLKRDMEVLRAHNSVASLSVHEVVPVQM